MQGIRRRRRRLAARRRAEAQEAGRRIGIEYVVLDNHDGELVPRSTCASKSFGRFGSGTPISCSRRGPTTITPTIVTRVSSSRTPPIWLSCRTSRPIRRRFGRTPSSCFQDGFQRPNPFNPDVAVSIDDVIEKIDMLDAHVSQFYEWLPWVAGNLDAVPKGAADRKKWLRGDPRWSADAGGQSDPGQMVRAGDGQGQCGYAEAFEICEHGTRPDEALIRKLFPLFLSPNCWRLATSA